MSESPDAGDELPAIAGVYVDTERYRRLLGLERQVRALLDALNQSREPDLVVEMLRLAESQEDDGLESLDPVRWELYQTLAALIEASGWRHDP